MQVVEHGPCIPASPPAYAGAADAANPPASPSIEGCRECSSGEGDMKVVDTRDVQLDDDVSCERIEAIQAESESDENPTLDVLTGRATS
jgi:hypothetical protein